MALYAAHLPLDLHEEYGNNMQLCRLLDVRDPRKFGRYHGVRIGYAGTFSKAMALDEVAEKLKERLRSSCRVHRFGKDRVRSIGIVSGGRRQHAERGLWSQGLTVFSSARSIWPYTTRPGNTA